MSSAPPFQGKVVMVTGAGSGIGRASAMAFGGSGASVVVSDVVVKAGEETVAAISAMGGKAMFTRADVASEAEVIHLLSETILRFGRLDCAHNCAGIEGRRTRTAELTLEEWERIQATNLRGTWLCLKHEVLQMLKQGGGGAIVNTASIAGIAGLGGYAAYAASKHGIVGLTQTAALEYAKQGLRINAVCPGPTRTPMVDRFTGGEARVEAQLCALTPAGRLGEPAEIASAVLWLCSEAASFVNGHALAVDGGWLAQ